MLQRLLFKEGLAFACPYKEELNVVVQCYIRLNDVINLRLKFEKFFPQVKMSNTERDTVESCMMTKNHA